MRTILWVLESTEIYNFPRNLENWSPISSAIVFVGGGTAECAEGLNLKSGDSGLLSGTPVPLETGSVDSTAPHSAGHSKKNRSRIAAALLLLLLLLLLMW